MHEQLSIMQMFRIACELEPTIVRDFVAVLRSSTLDSAFENFDRHQESIETERFFLRWDIALSVAGEVVAELELERQRQNAEEVRDEST